MRSKRVILDTNLWISFLISKRLIDIDKLIHEEKIKLIFSNESIEEFLTVAKRPKFQKFFTNSDLKEILQLFDKYGILVEVKIKVEECRDYKDNFLLSLAVESKANYLVSGDQDLLVLEKIKKTNIVNWKDFIKELK